MITPPNPLPPFRWTSDDLGLGNSGEPWIHFTDRTGQRWLTHSVQDILANIDNFADERDQHRLLAGAAVHYGFDDTWILIKGRQADEPLYDLLDDAGRFLLMGVTHHAAWLASEQLRQIPGWASGFRYARQRKGATRVGLLWDWRHEGPLELVARADGIASVMVRSHVGLCSVRLEEAMRRLDQFSAADQADLLSGLTCSAVTNDGGAL